MHQQGFTSVIIVNYKTKELTVNCVQSMQVHFNPALYEVIIVDNDSRDGSAAYLRKELPSAIIIESEKNIGFGSANNLGAQKASGEYILMLNSDTLVTANILDKFTSFYTSNSHLKPGVAGSPLIDEAGKVIHSFGNFPFPLRLLTGKCKSKADTLKDVEKNYFAPTKIVVGADMFIKRTVFEEAGGFDENIFLYEEELELQYRLQQKGYTQFVINEKSIIHLEGQSSDSWFKRRNSFISLCYVNKKHLPYGLYLLSRLRMILFAFIFFKNPRTSWKEKTDYLKLSILAK
jgi:GT2 family glycosyltransferase